MTPAQVHMQVDVLFNAGKFPINTVGDPGTQGAGVTGMHGIGVSTPNAAAVAAATAGLAIDMHMPNGMMFTIGMWSMMFAAGGPPAMVMFNGNTLRVLGANPKVHMVIAPETTSCAIEELLC